MRVLAIGNVFNPSGVSVHIKNVLKELVKMGDEVTLYVPSFLVRRNYEVLKDLESAHVNVHHSAYEVKEAEEVGTLPYFIKSHSVYLRWNDLGEDRKYIDELKEIKPDVIYDMHEDSITLRLSYHISKKLDKPLVKLLHDEPFRNSFGRGYRRFLGIKGLAYDILMWMFYKFDKRAFLRSINDGVLRGIAGVSKASFYLSGIEEIARDVRLKVYEVGNAFNRDIIYKYRKTKGKEDYAVFFARLVPQKGIRELPRIADLLNSKIVVFGKIFNERDRTILMSHPKIEYMGYRPIEEVYSTVSKAKVLIYPSHQDGFSLVVLDTLALGTSVVAYDIPAIRFVFSNLKPVRAVREYDVKEMARIANNILSMKDEEYESEHEDENVKKFLELHSSWANVAKETHDFLSAFL
ncbi:glycosyltransferase family 4 protein [Saccharolobus islandicus]|uniref:Glycosyl transferase group 1 n=2 Tax=Saccharolobus islandicus TaxID=43080 RepID=C4KL91_SACI6|nr:glycosyltransferase [Sulfolobus islandicus]ACP56298.1 glycosyl transferase group 1 [Sulfolobus islandicus M.16.27]ACR42972.1 glycosyl transferase group 1 [Sulfolobus islandicus M.16.4]